MPCVEKKADISKTRNKEGQVITTKTRKMVCGDRTEDLVENQEQEHLEQWEELIYPEALKAKPDMVEVVVADARTGSRYTKAVPIWAVDKVPDPDLVQQHLIPPEEPKSLKEVFSRFL